MKIEVIILLAWLLLGNGGNSHAQLTADLLETLAEVMLKSQRGFDNQLWSCFEVVTTWRTVVAILFFSHFVCCTKHSIVVYVMKCAIPLKTFSYLCKCKIRSNASDCATIRKRETKKCKTVMEFQKESFSQNCFCYGTLGLQLMAWENKKCMQRMQTDLQ